MGHVNIEGVRIDRPQIFGTKFVPQVRTITGAVILTDNDPDIVILSAAGAQNVDLPAYTAANNGRMFMIFSVGAGTLTVRGPSGARCWDDRRLTTVGGLVVNANGVASTYGVADCEAGGVRNR
jgi:hypothetical protein